MKTAKIKTEVDTTSWLDVLHCGKSASNGSLDRFKKKIKLVIDC